MEIKQENIYLYRLLLIVIGLCIGLNVHSSEYSLNAPHYYFRSLTIEDGLPHSDANATVQDKNGFMWIASHSGLVCYDGYTLNTYYNQSEMVNNAYNNRIFDLSLDDNGLLWLATSTGIQLFDPYQRRFIPLNVYNSQIFEEEYELEKILALRNSYLFVKTNTHRLIIYKIHDRRRIERIDFNLNAHCYSMHKDASENIWLGTNRGIFMLNHADLTPEQYTLPADLQQEEGTSVYYLLWDDANNLFIATQKHLFLSSDFNSKKTVTNVISETKTLNELVKMPIDFSAGLITDMVEDYHGRFWISSTKGLYLLQLKNQQYEVERLLSNSFNNNLTSDYIIRLFVDRSDNLFVSTYAGGVNILDLQQNAFHHIYHVPNAVNTLSEQIVRALADDDDYLWVGTNTMGLDRLNKKTGTISHFRYDGTVHSICSNEIRALLNDNEGQLWVGHTKGLDVIDITGNIPNVRHLGEKMHLPLGEVTSLAKDRFGHIWVGTWNSGLCKVSKNKQGEYKCTSLKDARPVITAFSPSRVIALYADTLHSDVFYSSGKQLVRLSLDEKGDICKSNIYQANPRNKNSLNSNFICSIRRENDSILWIGTLGGGINRMTLREDGEYVAQHLTDKEGLGMKDVECMEIDAMGNIWSGGIDLVKYSVNKCTYQSYQSANGKSIGGFKIGASCVGRDGFIYMAGVSGVICFDPYEIRENLKNAEPFVSSIEVNNQPIDFHKPLLLKYNQNNIKFNLTSLHYANPKQCKFEYRLLNYQPSWQRVPEHSNIIYFANLPYGNYLLEVKATNNDGKWSSHVYSLPVRISSPWWLSCLAKSIYVFLTLLLIVLVYIYFLRWYTLKRKLEIKELREKQDRRIQEIQLQFFTNISHEFRNPLTLILGTVERMFQEDAWNRSLGDSLMRNVQRLMKLVDDVMDFKKIETGKPLLKVQELDICSFIRKVTEDFTTLSYVKNKHFQVEIPDSKRLVWIDAEVLTKILMNLLNNAFKYTKEGSCIRVKLFDEGEFYTPAYKHQYKILNDYSSNQMFHLCVFDTGIGISKESIEQIFSRYYQIHDSEADPHLGSGIGLALVKSLVLLHKGTLQVSSERKKGTEFYLSIPCGISDYTESERLSHIKEKNLNEKVIDGAVKKTDSMADYSVNGKLERLPIVLLVEDDSEVRSFISASLENKYKVVQAVNGIDALQKMKNTIPDVIVSDLMMPEMDGNDLCKEIRQNDTFKQVPFILLTSSKSQDAQLEGINAGASAYLNKPVSMQLLDSTIHNLLESHKRLKEYVSSNYISSAIDETLQNKDKDFYTELIRTIEKHIANPGLDVTLLAEELGYSRTRLYQKVNEVTGYPIKELVRLIRLRKAIQLMVEEDDLITDVLLKIGIQSQSYFTTIFKKEYGKTPAAFIRDLKKSKE